MALATYKDLCLDASDARLLATFWGAALGLEVRDAGADSNGDYVLIGPTPQHTVWVNRVPEPRTVKQRVHLDLNVGSVDELTALGATVLDGESFAWTLMADPEGGELCAFVREGAIEQRLYEIVVNCTDREESHRVAAWWAEVLGARLGEEEDGWYVDQVPGAPFDCLVFGPVPEPRTVKNRVHLDVLTPDVDALVAAGATVQRRPDDEIRWTILLDPGGNELCAFVG